MPGAVANRYAKALADVVTDDQDSRQVQTQLEEFSSLLEKNTELRQVLTSPAFPLPKRKAVMEAVLKRVKFAKFTTNFLLLLLDNFRLELLEDICEAFKQKVDEQLGIVRVRVSAAEPLAKKQQTELQKSFETLTSKKVKLMVREDPTLVGGVVARLGSTVYDGSLKSKLERMSEHLISRTR